MNVINWFYYSYSWQLWEIYGIFIFPERHAYCLLGVTECFFIISDCGLWNVQLSYQKVLISFDRRKGCIKLACTFVQKVIYAFL